MNHETRRPTTDTKGWVPIDTDGPLGLLVGTSLLESDVFSGFDRVTVETEWEPVPLHQAGGIVARQRHEFSDGYRPPHRINHRANIQALHRKNVSTILSIQSTGSLSPSIEPGTFVVPDDFINPWDPVTFYDDERGHGVSKFSEPLRTAVLDTLRDEQVSLREGGIYFQTRGPRFETPAEADMLADYGDIVGMTAGSEVTLASEKDIRYVTVCSVDNYVNGVAGESIDMASFESSVREQLPVVVRTLKTLIQKTFNLTLPEGYDEPAN